jgi:uncharacterized protein YecT (DUF1311 family)
MRNTILFLMMVLGVALVGTGQTQENAQEAKAVFNKANHELNEAWAAVKKALSEADFSTLKEDQYKWLAYRDHLATTPQFSGAKVEGEVPMDSPYYFKAAADFTPQRTQWLLGLIRDWKDDTLTGLWSDSIGGTIEIVEKDGHLYFSIECVRGPTSHNGQIVGTAVWNQTIGWFSDKGRDKEKTDETNLSFILCGKKLEIVGANTGYYHGARAYFDGEYVRVQPLNVKAQTKVVKAAKSGEVPEE